jgi:hypothetical protein
MYIAAKEFFSEGVFFDKSKRITMRSIPFFLSVLPLLAFFLYWKGVTPPSSNLGPGTVTFTITRNFGQVTFLMIYLGSYFFIYPLVRWRKLIDKKILFIIPCLFFYWFFPLKENAGIEPFLTGAVTRILLMNAALKAILCPFFFFSGVMLMYLLRKEYNRELLKNKLFWLFVAFAGMMFTSKYIWERYYLLCLPVAILLIYRKIDLLRLKYYYYWMALLMLASGSYFTYKFFIEGISFPTWM